MSTYEDCLWWEKNGSEAKAKAITAALEVIDKFRGPRIQYLTTCARLYGNLPPITYFGGTQTLDPADVNGPMFVMNGGRLTRNVIQSCVDTIQARVASRIHAMIMWLTTGGTYRARRKARRLTQFCDAVFREQNTKTLMPFVFKDAEIFGSGYIQPYLEYGKIKYERFLEHELHWDEIEARFKQPSQLHRVRPVDTRRLEAVYSKKKAIIRQAASKNEQTNDTTKSLSATVEVRESWRLSNGPDDKGVHIVSIDTGVLLEEEWDHDFFPVVKVDYNPRPMGWTGQGLPEILCDTQVALNRHLQALSTSLYLAGTYKLALLEGSRVDPNMINNGFGTAFWYRNPPGGGSGLPVYIEPKAFPAEGYQEIARLEQKAYQLAGVSVTSAAGIKQPGVNAAVAMREMVDIEADRFATISTIYEMAHVQLARVTVTLIADAKKRGEITDYTVKNPGSRYRPLLSFNDIGYEHDMFMVQPFPVNSLPKEPAGRLQKVQEWVSSGWITPRDARRLMEFPDVQSWENMQDAATEWIEYCLDRIVEDGEYEPPSPDEDDLQTALELVTQEISLAKLGGLERERLKMLREWRDEVSRLIQLLAPPPPPMPIPLGKPAPKQVSELMPVAQQPIPQAA